MRTVTRRLPRPSASGPSIASSTWLRIVSQDTTPPATSSTAQISMAVPYAASNTAGSAYSSPPRPTATGSAATASSVPERATALLTPLAMPACSSGAAARTVAVSGATISDRPRPKSVAPGSTSSQ